MRKASLKTFLLPVFCIAVVMGAFGCSPSEEADAPGISPSGGPSGGPGRPAGRPGGPGGPGGSEGTTAIEVGKTTTIALPESADAASVTWESSDESVATVSATGEVTAVAAGKVIITAKDKDGKTVTSKPLSVEASAQAGSDDKE